MRLLLAGLLAGLACTPLLPAADFDHQPWHRILQSAVNEMGEVDYQALKGNAALQAYVDALKATSPRSRKFASREAELAYWINAYNALVTWGVARAYPTKSVRDLGALYGFFRRKEYTLGGQTMSLQQLENQIIRQGYHEPRIHFAIVCASLSCPKLSRRAYTAANLEEQLEFQTRQYFAETRNLHADAARNTVTLAAILDWYKEDFGNARPALLQYALRYAPANHAAHRLKNPRLNFRDYDWSINDPGSRARAKTAEERELALAPR